MRRREFLATPAAAWGAVQQQGRAKRPNVVLIITDDQGYGDIGIHGNEKIRTPNMDRIAREGVQFTQFHVCPVCSPTRASLLTGRYNYRTGVVDTYIGRSMMHPDEVALPEMLAAAGYRTGIFGKWHLGDNYPLRPVEHGFHESVVIKGGGLGQPSDFPGGGSYFDPILLHNGRPERFKGYCSDIYTAEALKFIDANRDRPFFVYLATNAPHTPLEISTSYAEPYLKAGLDDRNAKVYGMVTNMDDNIGRVLAKLKELGLEDDTIVIFLTDNGPQWARYNAGMRGTKGTVYEGGIRVPFFVRWPRVVKAETKVDRLAGHIDVVPTLLEACGAQAGKHSIDGRSLMPLLRDPEARWENRVMFFQWHRGDEPVLYRDCAARDDRWKMVKGSELYDLQADPAEAKDVAAEHPAELARLRKAYEDWFKDVSAPRGYAPPRIHVGARQENPVILTRQDWRGPRAGWDKTSLGHWEVLVVEAAEYEVLLRFSAAAGAGTARFRLNGASLEGKVAEGQTEAALGRVRIGKGAGRVEAEVDCGNGAPVGVHFVEIRRV
jgi:arylsulfatase A-like enzyme